MHRYTRGIAAAVCVCLLAACGAKQTGVAAAPEQARTRQAQKHETSKSETPTRATFVQEGVAGGYGADAFGAGTSKSERYDIQVMTAVHRTLPLGISVKVRNLRNNREAVVLVSGRGPLVKGRIIDLSYAASIALGIGEKDTALVRIEALGFRTAGSGRETYRQPENLDAGTYTVQVGMFVKEQNPDRIRDAMQKLAGYSEMNETHMQDLLLYRVFAGKYTSLAAAEAAAINFTRHGYPASIVFSLE